MKRLALGLAVMTAALTGCSHVTMLRTQEMKAVGSEVQASVEASASHMDSSVTLLKVQNDSLLKELKSARASLDSLQSALNATRSSLGTSLDSAVAMLDAASFAQKRMQAELKTLSRRVSDESERNDSRQEEIIYRLDLLLGKSDKILAKKVVISGAPAPASDSTELAAEKLVEAEAMYNTARSDFHRGEYKLAFAGYRQVYDQMKTGDLAERSLYGMAQCLIEANQTEKAMKVLTRQMETFPEGPSVCAAMFKMASLYNDDCDIPMQKQYLQKILSTKNCESSGEFEQAANILQEILENEERVNRDGFPAEVCIPKPRPVEEEASEEAAESAPAAALEQPVPYETAEAPAEVPAEAAAPAATDAAPTTAPAAEESAAPAATAPAAEQTQPAADSTEASPKADTVEAAPLQ